MVYASKSSLLSITQDAGRFAHSDLGVAAGNGRIDQSVRGGV
jgi:hypothetical protein